MSTSSLAGLRVRPLSIADAAMVEMFLNACNQHDLGENWLDTGELEREWQALNFCVPEQTYALFADDQLIAYAEIWDIEPPFIRARGFFRVHPAWRDRGIEDHLMAWIVETSKRNLARAPQNLRVALIMSADSRLSDLCAAYQRHGLRHVRSYYQMQLELDAPPPEPIFPEGISLRTFVKGQDDRAVFEAFDEAFSDHYDHISGRFDWFQHHSINNPLSDFSMWYLAMAGDQIAGLCLCSKSIAEDPQLGWVDDLAVRRPYRKRGLGLALLRTAFGEFYRRGYRKVGLSVDPQNLTGALRLYERAGMRPIRTWLRYELVLREGENPTAQALTAY